MSWLCLGKTYYYLWSSPERTSLFLKQMFCKTYCDRLIRAGNGPMLGYQPHKGTYLPASFPSIPHYPPPCNSPPRHLGQRRDSLCLLLLALGF